jgi:hypothetical protein
MVGASSNKARRKLRRGGSLIKAGTANAWARIRPVIANVLARLSPLDGITFFTALLALFTALLVFVAYLQWRTSERTDQTLRLQQRAWLAMRGLVAPDNFKNKTDKYTEIPFRLENTGREPALKVHEVMNSSALEVEHFRDVEYMNAFIKTMLNGQVCEGFGVNPNGRAIFPKGSPGGVIGFSENDTKKVNGRSAYALVVGCFVYETLGETHRTKSCTILEPPLASDNWRSTDCIVHNDAY